MTKIFAIAALAVTLSAPFAAAQSMVIGSGLAKDCYSAAKFNNSTARGEKICTRAITEETMTVANRAATFTNRGILRMRAEKYELALADYDRSKRMRPDVGATYLNEGAARILTKDFNGALDVLDKAIELKSVDLHAAYYNRAIARENTGNLEGAYLDFKQALEIDPTFERAQQQLERFTVTGG